MLEIVEQEYMESDFYRTIEIVKMHLLVNNIEQVLNSLFKEEWRLRYYANLNYEEYISFLNQVKHFIDKDEKDQAIRYINIKLKNRKLEY